MNNQNLKRQVLNVRHFSLVMFFMLLFTYSCSEQNGMDTSLNADDSDAKTEELERLLLTKSFDSDAFITEWNIQAGDTVVLPLVEGYEYTFMVDWGDGSGFNMVTSYASPNAVHVYTSRGTFQISILGKCEALSWSGCNELRLIKVIQWGNVGFKTFLGTFSGCKSLQSIPSHMPNVEFYFSAFQGCMSLKEIPTSLFDLATDATSFALTFADCSELRVIPEHLFDNCSAVIDFSNTFLKCNIMFIPQGLFNNCTKVERFMGTFKECRYLKVVPAGLFNNCTYASHFELVFSDCYSLIELPDYLFENCVAANSFIMSFANCTRLSYIPENLFANCYNAKIFGKTFSGCTSLHGHTPLSNGFELWDRAGKTGYPTSINGGGCFKDCVGLSNYNSIPANWK